MLSSVGSDSKSTSDVCTGHKTTEITNSGKLTLRRGSKILNNYSLDQILTSLESFGKLNNNLNVKQVLTTGIQMIKVSSQTQTQKRSCDKEPE